MASSSPVQVVVDSGLPMAQVAQPSDIATSAGVPEVPAGCVEADQEPRGLPKIFNLEWQREGMPDTEFNRTYPPDAWGEEAGPNARVWKIYRDRQTGSDKRNLEGWNSTLDVLLIFAGLFSAVLTAFLIESYKALQPDYTQYVAVFLYAAAVSHNRTGGVLPALDTIVAPDLFIQTSNAQRWTNGLWFSSLVISLAVALVCILIKQWLDAYNSHVSAAAPSPIHWARRHKLYYHGLNKWGLPGLISFLPLLLHLSLFLFFIGLILFLRPLDGAISYSLLVMISCIGAFYILSLFLPALRVECPSYTPLLVQAMLAVSRVLSGPLYIIRPLSNRLLFSYSKVGRFLFRRIWPVRHWLDSIQLSARQHVVRETQTISKCDMELDGYVLNTLIHMRTDTNDVINTAFVAIGAITSKRTIETICSKLPEDVFADRINDCWDDIPSGESGFALTSKAQLQRALLGMCSPDPQCWGSSLQPFTPGILSPLGIDGLLLRSLVTTEDQVGSFDFDIDALLRSLNSLSKTGDSCCGYPTRSMCLMFLKAFSKSTDQRPSFVSCFLLVFCAGRFASADMHVLVRALQLVETVLGAHCSITLRAHNGGEQEYVLAVVNGLWNMLADFSQYHLDAETAQIVAENALECFHKGLPFYGGVAWEQVYGLSTLVRSPAFTQCVGTRDSLPKYISLLSRMCILDSVSVPLGECIAILLKLSSDYMPRPMMDGAFFSLADKLFPVDRLQCDILAMRIKDEPYAKADDWYEPVLSVLLDSPNTIVTWTCANSPEYDERSADGLASLARRISIVLCRRTRLGRANDIFIPAFFSGSFLLARFQELTPQEAWPAVYQRGSFEYLALDLAKHCLKLSPERFMAICAQLEKTGDPGSELRSCAVAFAQRLRDGSAPGGALSAECNANCPCMLPGPRAPPSIRAYCDVLVARLRGGRNTSMTPSNVCA